MDMISVVMSISGSPSEVLIAGQLGATFKSSSFHMDSVGAVARVEEVKELGLEKSPQLKEEIDGCVVKTPMGRAGKPEEVAALIAFLCFPAAYITGQIIYADGGFTANGGF
ncbi:Tropinone reductase 1 [Capsicum annuum]|nr:Tropinone reductase 1 [Capsicum annuum]